MAPPVMLGGSRVEPLARSSTMSPAVLRVAPRPSVKLPRPASGAGRTRLKSAEFTAARERLLAEKESDPPGARTSPSMARFEALKVTLPPSVAARVTLSGTFTLPSGFSTMRFPKPVSPSRSGERTTWPMRSADRAAGSPLPSTEKGAGPARSLSARKVTVGGVGEKVGNEG